MPGSPFCTVPPDSMETEIRSSDQETLPDKKYKGRGSLVNVAHRSVSL